MSQKYTFFATKQACFYYTFFKKESSISLTTTTKSSVEGMPRDAHSSLRRLAQATNSFVAVSLVVKFPCLLSHRAYIGFFILMIWQIPADLFHLPLYSLSFGTVLTVASQQWARYGLLQPVR